MIFIERAITNSCEMQFSRAIDLRSGVCVGFTYLEYSFGLATCNLGDRTRTFPNPFTGETITVPVDDGLSASECTALRTVIHATGFKKSAVSGEGFELRLSQDESVRLRDEIEIGVAGFSVELVVVSLSNVVLDLLLSIARAGNLAFTSSTGGHVCLVTPATTRVAARWPDAVTIKTRDDVQHWLEGVIRGRRVTL